MAVPTNLTELVKGVSNLVESVGDALGKARDFNPVETIWGNWTPVVSSNIRAYRYNEGERVLEIQFNTGRVYGFKDVPKNIVEEFSTADSKGKYFNSAIRHSYSTT